jgi:hypothetical protein
MGTWGEGVFDNDAACDFRSDIKEMEPEEAKQELLREIRGFGDDYDVEDIDLLLAGVAMLTERLAAGGEKASKLLDAAKLKKQCLKIFDRDFDQLQPAEGHKEGRRKVIVDTFDALAKCG